MSPDALRQPVRPAVLRNLIGVAALPAAAVTAAPALFALGAGDTAFAVRSLIVTVAFLALRFLCRPEEATDVQRNEARVVTALLFAIVPLAMAVPMATHARLGGFDAVFESISAITTTGLSLMDPEGAAPSLLFARAWLQWIGGFGIVALSLAVLVPPGAVSAGLAESTVERLGGRSVRDLTRRLFVTYVILTATVVIALMATGLAPLRALLFAFSSVSTGGMSPDAHSVRDLVPGAQVITLAGAVFGSIPLLWLGFASKGADSRLAIRQILTGLLAIAVVGTVVLYSLSRFRGAEHGATLWNALTLTVSAQTTAGFETFHVPDLDQGSKLAMCFAMATGGSSGSTAGGIKVLRLLILLAIVKRWIGRTSLPRDAVLHVRVAGIRFDDDDIRRVLVVTMMFGATVLLSWLPFVVYGFAPLDALFEVVSATGTVGLSTGLTDPGLPTGLKAVLAADMLLGRLEFLAVLLILYPGTWVTRWRDRAFEILDSRKEL